MGWKWWPTYLSRTINVLEDDGVGRNQVFLTLCCASFLVLCGEMDRNSAPGSFNSSVCSCYNSSSCSHHALQHSAPRGKFGDQNGTYGRERRQTWRRKMERHTQAAEDASRRLSVLGFLVLRRRWLVWPPLGCRDWGLWEGKEDFEEDWMRIYLLHWLSGFPSCFDPSTVQTKWNWIWAAALSGHVTAT